MKISLGQLVLLIFVFLLLFYSNSQVIKNFRELIRQFLKQISK